MKYRQTVHTHGGARPGAGRKPTIHARPMGISLDKNSVKLLDIEISEGRAQNRSDAVRRAILIAFGQT